MWRIFVVHAKRWLCPLPHVTDDLDNLSLATASIGHSVFATFALGFLLDMASMLKMCCRPCWQPTAARTQ
jgi:hypothetical protein